MFWTLMCESWSKIQVVDMHGLERIGAGGTSNLNSEINWVLQMLKQKRGKNTINISPSLLLISYIGSFTKPEVFAIVTVWE